jgi:Dyp-type peroxidase family
LTSYLVDSHDNRNNRLKRLSKEKRKQAGIEFPKPSQQQHLLVIRLDLASHHKGKEEMKGTIQEKLKGLCGLFEQLDNGKRRIDKLDDNGRLSRLTLEEFHFSATVGFGIGFFDKLGIPDNKRPKKIKSMPDHVGLGDVTTYTLAQTDLIIQLGSISDFVNRWVFENNIEPAENKRTQKDEKEPPDIVRAIGGWATVTDLHAGFQRIDGRNLMGFNDGISNPSPGSGDKFDNVVWTTEEDEGPILRDGTYMAFQKIEHDLEQWRELSVKEQEKWVGRNKVTGLLLGTPENEDKKFIEGLNDDDAKTKEKLRNLLKDQSDPEKQFYDFDISKNNIPAWSHIRKANPRQEKMPNGKRLDKRLIFRRGYPFIETGLNNETISGLLFVSFQRDIENTFEFIKKNWLNKKDFPAREYRPFTKHELNKRRSQGLFSSEELQKIRFDSSKRQLLGLDDNNALKEKMKEIENPDTQNTGREGFAGPSKLGVIPTGQFLASIPYGGGYYFIPPIPEKCITLIGQQFFEKRL